MASSFKGSSSSNHPNQTSHTRQDARGELLHDAFNMHQVVHEDLDSNRGGFNGLNDEGETHNRVGDEQHSMKAAKFYNLLENMNKKFYEGSEHFRLYFCICLFHLKCMCRKNRKGLNYLIEFLKEFFSLTTIPASRRKSKKIIKDLGLWYAKIHTSLMIACSTRVIEKIIKLVMCVAVLVDCTLILTNLLMVMVKWFTRKP